MKASITYILLILLLSCTSSKNQQELNNTENLNSANKETALIPAQTPKMEKEKEEEVDPIPQTEYDFGAFKLIINGVDIQPAYRVDSLNRIYSELDMETEIEGVTFEIIPTQGFENYSVELKYEYTTNMYLPEDRNESLEQWTKEIEENRLHNLSANSYRIKSHEIDFYEEYIKENFDSLKVQSVNAWPKEERIADARKIEQLPIELWVSRANIYITVLDGNDLKKIHTLSLAYPYGC